MAQLPSVRNFGGPKRVQASSPILTTDAGTRAPVAERQAAQDIGQLSQGLNAAGERIQRREDAVERANVGTSHEEALAAEMRRMSVEEDISTSASIEKYRAFQQKLSDQALGALSGSANGRADITSDLTKLNAGWYDKFAVANITAGREKVADTITNQQTKVGQEIQTLVRENPFDPAIMSLIDDKIQGFSKFTDNFKGSIDTNTERDIKQLSTEGFLVTGITALFEAGNVDGAESALNSLSKPEAALSGAVRTDQTDPIRKRIETRRFAENKISRDISQKVSTTAAALANPPAGMTRGEVAQLLGSSTGTTTGTLNTSATMVSNMLADNMPIENVRGILTAMIGASPDKNTKAGLEAIAEALPTSLEEYNTAKGDAAIAEKAPIVNKLIAQGIDKKSAHLMVHGANASITIPTTDLTQTQISDIQASVRSAANARAALTNILPQITDETVGVWGMLRDTEVAGIAVQLPVINKIAGMFGFSVEQVQEAQQARASMRESVGILSKFISQKGTRLSNEDRAFSLRALKVFDASTTAATAQNVIRKLMDSAARVEGQNYDILESGKIERPGGDPSDITIVEEEPGVFIARDANGIEQDRFTLEEQ